MVGLACILLYLAAEPLPPLAPMHRSATIFDRVDRTLIDGQEMYVSDGAQLVRLNLPDQTAWTNKTEGAAVSSWKLHPKWVITARNEPKGKHEIVGLNRKTGAAEWRLPAEEFAEVFAASDTLYCSRARNRFEAVDLNTLKTLWKFDLEEDDMVNAVGASGGLVFLSNYENTIRALDAKTGRLVWRKNEFNVFNDEVQICDGALLHEKPEATYGIEAATGRELWTLQGRKVYGAIATPAGFASDTEDAIVMISPKSGKVLWTSPLIPSDTATSGDGVSLFQGRLLYSRFGEKTLFDLDGKKVWTVSADEMLGDPQWTDGKTFITAAGGLYKLEAGPYPPLPIESEARQRAAEAMIEAFASLSPSEVERLTSLGDDAFPSILRAYLREGEKVDAAPKAPFLERRKFYAFQSILQKISSPRRAPELEEAYMALKPTQRARPVLEGLFAEYGDPSKTLPYFLNQLKNADPELWGRQMSTGFERVSQSSDPAAVAFMIDVLKNKDLSDDIREVAYVNLARVGGEVGRQAVRSERITEVAPLPPLETRMGLSRIGTEDDAPELLDQFTDAAGRQWGLVASGILGNNHDLWVVEQIDGNWTRPVFTGLQKEFQEGPFSKRSAQGLDGKSPEEIVAGAWKTLLVGRASLIADADKDGLSDLAEKRLGTNPALADSDGDSRSDATDAFPTVRPRSSLSETEQVFAAAFEARYHFAYEGDSPAVLEIKGVETPYEMPGWRGPVLWSAASPTTELSDQYENGIALISVEMSKEPRTPEEVRDQIYRVEISTYYGGLNGSGYVVYVQKFGSDWLATNSLLAYES